MPGDGCRRLVSVNVTWHLSPGSQVGPRHLFVLQQGSACALKHNMAPIKNIGVVGYLEGFL